MTKTPIPIPNPEHPKPRSLFLGRGQGEGRWLHRNKMPTEKPAFQGEAALCCDRPLTLASPRGLPITHKLVSEPEALHLSSEGLQAAP